MPSQSDVMLLLVGAEIQYVRRHHRADEDVLVLDVWRRSAGSMMEGQIAIRAFIKDGYPRLELAVEKMDYASGRTYG